MSGTLAAPSKLISSEYLVRYLAKASSGLFTPFSSGIVHWRAARRTGLTDSEVLARADWLAGLTDSEVLVLLGTDRSTSGFEEELGELSCSS